MTDTVKIEMRPGKRRGTPRAQAAVRARISHTATNKRRLDVYVTDPVLRLLGWELGGRLHAAFSTSPFPATVILTPSHNGVRITVQSKKSRTGRVVVTSDIIRRGTCAPVRDVSFRVIDGALAINLPPAWFALEQEAA